jgi:flavorubredoxin
MGGSIALDERVSWAPPNEGRFQPLNSYLLKEGSTALVIDPGPACQGDLVVEQLGTLIPPGGRISLYLTRPEFDTFGCLGRLAESFDVDRLYGGGQTNPFDAFDHVTMVDPTKHVEPLELARVAPGAEIEIAPERHLVVLRPTIRVLVTYWVYDQVTRTLFSSDAFSHGLMDTPDGSRVITGAGGFDAETVRRRMLAKFWWLPHAGKAIENVTAHLTQTFERYQIDTIAPCRGAVIHGREAVEYHYGLVLEILREIAQKAPSGGRLPAGAS